MVHSCHDASSIRTSLYPTVVSVITVMWKASVKLHPSKTMYPKTPTAVMITSARTALCTRRNASRGSYDLLYWKPLLSDLLRSSSATAAIIVERPSTLGQTPSASQRQHLRAHLAVLSPEQRERMLWLPSPVRRASGVEQQEPSLVLEPGDVRVSEDDHPRPRETPPHPVVASLLPPRVVDHGDRHTAELEPERLRQPHLRRVQVTPHRPNGGVGGQVLKERGLHQVAGVQDQICPLQVGEQGFRQCPGTPRYMSVGDDGGERAQIVGRSSCLPFKGVSERSQSETCAGCIVSLTTETSSAFSASRSVSSRRVAEKASRVFLASYLLR